MAAVPTPDLLTAYASSQPGKLAVVDDRPGADTVSWTYAQLPRTGSGKLLKRELRAPYWAGHTRQVG